MAGKISEQFVATCDQISAQMHDIMLGARDEEVQIQAARLLFEVLGALEVERMRLSGDDDGIKP